MDNVDVLIPTCKSYDSIVGQVKEIVKNSPQVYSIHASCFLKSAAINRNYCHGKATTNIVVSCDDDIEGYYPGWLEELIRPLGEDKDIRLVSARLMNNDGTIGFMMTSKNDISQDYEAVFRCPTSCFAYRKKDFDELMGFWNKDSWPFDENFVGSGWEDNAICHDLKKKFIGTKIIINNRVKLIHRNEQKNQKENLLINKECFYRGGRGE